MKKSLAYLLIFLTGLFGIGAFFTVYSDATERKNAASSQAYLHSEGPTTKKVVAYVTSNSETLPDPMLMDHIYYAFGNVAQSYDSVIIMNPQKLRKLSGLKKENPDLKITLSIQTLPRDGFAKMTASDSLRGRFVAHCKKVMEEYDLDGLDLDWEFPATNAGMHQGGGNDDPLHYSWLARDLKNMMGADKTLSFYSSNSSKYNDLKLMVPYVDYVMVSGYNLGTPPFQHQSNLYPSKRCGDWSISKSVEAHIEKGVPAQKIMIGVPFYARTGREFQEKNGLKDNYVANRHYSRYFPGYKAYWDRAAKAPYYSTDGKQVIGAFDNERSIDEKCKFVNDRNLAGIFYWHYDAESDDHLLAKAIRNGIHSRNIRTKN